MHQTAFGVCGLWQFPCKRYCLQKYLPLHSAAVNAIRWTNKKPLIVHGLLLRIPVIRQTVRAHPLDLIQRHENIIATHEGHYRYLERIPPCERESALLERHTRQLVVIDIHPHDSRVKEQMRM